MALLVATGRFIGTFGLYPFLRDSCRANFFIGLSSHICAVCALKRPDLEY